MRGINLLHLSLFFLLFFFIKQSVNAGTLSVAVSSNFSQLIKPIIVEFKKNYSVEVNVSIGSTANIYHQIINGAPYDIFLAADQKHPKLLRKKNFSTHKNFTYACGKLVLWSKKKLEKPFDLTIITNNNKVISIANPKTAPYGKAAKEYLINTKTFNSLEKNLVIGTNVAQVFHFAKTKSVDFAFVALSQIKYYNVPETNFYIIPKELYKPIMQDAIILNNDKNTKLSEKFYNFLKTNKIRDIIKRNGYDINC